VHSSTRPKRKECVVRERSLVVPFLQKRLFLQAKMQRKERPVEVLSSPKGKDSPEVKTLVGFVSFYFYKKKKGEEASLCEKGKRKNVLSSSRKDVTPSRAVLHQEITGTKGVLWS